jgi:hypothetical protein
MSTAVIGHKRAACDLRDGLKQGLLDLSTIGATRPVIVTVGNAAVRGAPLDTST